MRQSRLMSLVEAVTNVAVGLVVAVATQLAVLPILGLQASLGQNLKLALVFTAVSIRAATRSGAFQRDPLKGPPKRPSVPANAASPGHLPRCALIAATIMAWSSSEARPETVMAPMTPVSTTRMGKLPP